MSKHHLQTNFLSKHYLSMYLHTTSAAVIIAFHQVLGPEELLGLLCGVPKACANGTGDLVHWLVGGDVADLALARVVGDGPGGLGVEGHQPLAQGLHVVVPAGHQRLARHVVLARHLGGLEVDVVAAAGGGVRQPARDALLQHLVGHLQVDHRVDLLAAGPQDLVQLLRLDDGAGEPVQQEALGALGGLDGLADHAHHDVVRDQRARLHHRLHLLAHFASRLDSSTQHVTSGKMAHAVLILYYISLGSFPRSRRSNENGSLLLFVGAVDSVVQLFQQSLSGYASKRGHFVFSGI
mmetsp:Transcript_16461/g.26867  ORF Transcript_16461/g.26867 Transcript_16461/m.26867 type:complete len:294 (-) Transcript_16461:12-893(-)